ncbi:MAG: hypothetical protein V3V74_07240 [Nitrosomonadaceae bacterium]
MLEKYGQRDQKFIAGKNLSFDAKRKNDLCGLVIDGKPCIKLVNSLGLCRTHYCTLRNLGLIDQFSKPHSRPRVETLAVKKKLKPGRCRIVRNGKDCINLIYLRGVCRACHSMLFRHGCLDDYCLPKANLHNADYTINSKKRIGLCRIKVEGDVCDRKIYSRGLCRKHYSNFWSRGTLEKFAEPDKEENNARR